MGFPNMDGVPATNLYEEHVYVLDVTFGSSSAIATAYGKDVTIAKTTTTTFTITLPQSYARITRYHCGRKAAASVAGLEFIVTTDSVATDGTVVLTSIESDSGSATAPAEGDRIWITLGVTQSDLNDRFSAVG